MYLIVDRFVILGPVVVLRNRQDCVAPEPLVHSAIT